MKSAIALALTFSCLGLVAAISPACSSSSSPTTTQTDSGSGGKDTGGGSDTGTGKDTSPTDTGSGGACSSPQDAAAYLKGGGSPCATCLATQCTGGNLLEQCACEPVCVAALQQLDECTIADGSPGATSCALTIIGDIDASTDAGIAAQATGAALLGCVQSTCGVCTATPEAGAGEGGSDAGDGGDAG